MKAEVIINDIHVDLSEDFSITIEKNSRLTQFKELIDTWAYNITFPRTETNEAAFEHVERFEKKFITWQEYPFIFIFNGRLILRGKIKAKYRSGKYEGYAFGSFGSVASSDLSKKISSLAFPDITFVNKAEFTHGVDPYCLFPVYNIWFYQGRSTEVEIAGTTAEFATYQFITTQFGYQNRFDPATDLFIRPAIKDEYYAVISPFMFAGWLVQQMFEIFGIKTVSNILNTDSLLKQCCIYTNFDIAKIEHNGWTIDTPSGGDWQTGTGIIVKSQTTSKAITDFNPADLLPDNWSVADFLIGLQNFLNIIFDFSDKNPEVQVVDREAIFTGTAIDINSKLLFSPELELENQKKVILKFGIDDNDSIWKTEDPLRGFTEFTDEQRARYKDELETTAALIAITEKEIGDIYYVAETHKYYEYKKWTEEVEVEGLLQLQEFIQWYPLSIYGQPYHVGTEEADKIEIESKFGVVYGEDNADGNLMLLTGNSEEYANDPKAFVPRIMLYKGLVGGLPYAPSLGGDMDLNWRGDNGIYEKRWKHTVAAVKDGIKGIAYFDFDEVDFTELNLNKKFRIDEGSFIIEKSSTTFTLNDIKPTEANILKLP